MADSSLQVSISRRLSSFRLWRRSVSKIPSSPRSSLLSPRSSLPSVPSLILPTEIWLAILDYLTRQEIKSLASTCKLFRSALFPLFRRTAVIDLGRPASYAEAPVPIDHRRMVTNLTVLVSNQIQRREFDNAISLHLPNLEDFSNLTEFHWAQHHPILKEVYLFLRSHPSLRVLTTETESDVLSERLLGGLSLLPPRCALTMTSIGKYEIMKDIFQYGSATRKTIAHLVILDAYLLQALHAEIAFPSLVHLDLHLTFRKMYLPFLFKFLGSNPTIERITLNAHATDPWTSTHERPPTLPRLKHFIAEIRSCSPFLFLAFGRRTLETLRVAGAALSEGEVQSILWEGLNVIDIILDGMEAQDALVNSIKTLGSSGRMAWRRVTIRTSNMESWTDHLDVLRKFLTVMANRAPNLTHFHVTSWFYIWWQAQHQTYPISGESIHALHGVAGCLNAFPGWVEAKVSCPGDIRFIRFIRGKAGMEPPQKLDVSVWLGTFEEYSIEIKGWSSS